MMRLFSLLYNHFTIWHEIPLMPRQWRVGESIMRMIDEDVAERYLMLSTACRSCGRVCETDVICDFNFTSVVDDIGSLSSTAR